MTNNSIAQRAGESLAENPDIRIEKLSRNHGVSPRRLRRLFRNFFGVSPKDYRSQMRIKNAIGQLQSGDFDRLADVAYDNGFTDPTHFCREFKKHTGKTPGNFSRHQRKGR